MNGLTEKKAKKIKLRVIHSLAYCDGHGTFGKGATSYCMAHT